MISVVPNKQIEMTIPLLNLNREHSIYKIELEQAIKKVINNTEYILGAEVKELENELAAYLGVNSCIGVASGTDALLVSLRALAMKTKGKEYFSRNDEIITTSFTFTATGSAILRSGATPVFVDIDPVTYNLDPLQVKRAVNVNTVGVLPVHLYGQACKMDDLKTIAKTRSIFIVEDVAQAFGATYGKNKLGSMGDLGAFSFFPSKNLGCFGDGGMVSTKDSDLAILVEMLRKHGGKDKYNVEYLGYNSRLDTVQAAIILVKLKYVDQFNRLRRKIADDYNHLLADLDWLVTPVFVKEEEHVYHQYTVRIKNGKRDQVQKALKEKGIASAVYYPVPLHKMKLFIDRCIVRTPLSQTEKACNEVLSLPVEPLLTEEEIDYVIRNIRNLSYRE